MTPAPAAGPLVVFYATRAGHMVVWHGSSRVTAWLAPLTGGGAWACAGCAGARVRAARWEAALHARLCE